MLQDSCTWDADYNQGVVEPIRRELVRLATGPEYESDYSAVLLQGSGSYVVESVLGSAIGVDECLLIINNGAYGARMGEMARCLGLRHHELDCGETSRPEPAAIEAMLARHPEITHLAMVHCETTTGMLNPLDEVAALCQRRGIRLIVDAMSSFGGIPIDMGRLGIEFLISSANKCIQGVPGFGFVIARRVALVACAGRARSVSLDLHAQWQTMEQQGASGALPRPPTPCSPSPRRCASWTKKAGLALVISVTAKTSAPWWRGWLRLALRPCCQKNGNPHHHRLLLPGAPGLPLRRLLPAAQGAGLCHLPGQGLPGRLLPDRQYRRCDPARVRSLLAAMASACYWQGAA